MVSLLFKIKKINVQKNSYLKSLMAVGARRLTFLRQLTPTVHIPFPIPIHPSTHPPFCTSLVTSWG